MTQEEYNAECDQLCDLLGTLVILLVRQSYHAKRAGLSERDIRNSVNAFRIQLDKQLKEHGLIGEDDTTTTITA